MVVTVRKQVYLTHWQLTVCPCVVLPASWVLTVGVSRAVFCGDVVISCGSLPPVAHGDKECGKGGTWG